MILKVARRLMTAAMMSVAVVSAASAQNFDGSGMVRFGIFGAGEFHDFKSVPGGDKASLDGGAIGFTAGYDLVFHRRMVLGIEADLSVGDTQDRLRGVRTHVDYLASLRGRLGFFATPDLLIYGTGGAAWVGHGIEDTFFAVNANTGIDSNTARPGWLAGGGIEYDFRDYFGTIFFAEYLIGSFETWKSPPGLNFDIESDVQTFRIGVKFKVGYDYDRPTYGEPLK